ncbi:Coexpressed With Polycystins [Caenorhabditis elegans]|uniref:Coexpressed With Polycystins n=1 Tax=Caenorhabditis elegans TaxID=6239 RepID=P91140_CAEEL|nr:Coexpressed With Polycystins [Caenorhabditis elegans]CCD66983.1 Coexpressed With Polycystins [Caenorhabditis elegans]|eukprot:NP_504296.2 Coexpressed With Polycystins [Caenorhabditis elegans]
MILKPAFLFASVLAVTAEEIIKSDAYRSNSDCSLGKKKHGVKLSGTHNQLDKDSTMTDILDSVTRGDCNLQKTTSEDGTMTELLEIITSGALDQDSGVICGCSKSKATKICSKSRKTQKQMFENDAISQNLADLPDLPVGKEKTVIYYWNDFNGDEAV